MKDFYNDKDTKESQEALESGGKILTIDQGKTPIYVLESGYEDGYVHWVRVKGQGSQRVVCGGGLEGKGFAPDECGLCKHSMDIFAEARELDDAGKTSRAAKVRQQGNDLRAKYEAHFLVIKGEVVKIKDQKTGKKRAVADYEDGKVGVLAMTKRQYQDFLALLNGEKYPYVETKKDLLNRSIILDKAKRGDAMYATIEFVPSRNKTNKPEVEYKVEDFLTDVFVIDTEQIDKAVALLSGSGVAHEDDAGEDDFEDDDILDDEEVDEADDDLGADDFDDGFLDDVDDIEEVEEEEPEEKKTKPKTTKAQAKAKAAKAKTVKAKTSAKGKAAKGKSKKAAPDGTDF